MFKYLKLKRLERELEKKEQEISHLQEINGFLMSEINRRDQKIAELIQQKESKNPDPLNFEFPGTEKQFDDFWTKFYCPK